MYGLWMLRPVLLGDSLTLTTSYVCVYMCVVQLNIVSCSIIITYCYYHYPWVPYTYTYYYFRRYNISHNIALDIAEFLVTGTISLKHDAKSVPHRGHT